MAAVFVEAHAGTSKQANIGGDRNSCRALIEDREKLRNIAANKGPPRPQVGPDWLGHRRINTLTTFVETEIVDGTLALVIEAEVQQCRGFLNRALVFKNCDAGRLRKQFMEKSLQCWEAWLVDQAKIDR